MPIHYTTEGPIATLTIANGSVNPFTPEMHRQLHDALVRMLGDPKIRVGILTGAGARAFSAGDDIKTPGPVIESRLDELTEDLTPAHRLAPDRPSYSWEYEVVRLERYKPIVGAVRGWCLGQGLLYLLLLTDLRVASEDAKFGFPEIAYGMGGAGGLAQLGRQIPHAVAMRMLLTGEPIDASEALRVGMINEVVAGDAVVEAAQALAEQVARHPAIGVRIEMEAYQRGMDTNRLDSIRLAEHLYRIQRLALGGDETVETFFRPAPRDSSP